MLRRTLIIGLAASLSGCGPHYDQKEAERYIVDSERQWAESVANGDTTVLERILADDFLGVDPKGPFYDKAKMIADTREAPKYFASNHLNAVKVRFYGDTAVAQGQRDMGAAERRTWTLRRDRHVGATER
jgi:ketosteroid isomerase-like protein